MPYLVFATLSTGADHNNVMPGMVVSYPDPSDRSPTISAGPSHPPDPEYSGEALTVLVYGSPNRRFTDSSNSARIRGSRWPSIPRNPTSRPHCAA
jgi:hypothetical protein